MFNLRLKIKYLLNAEGTYRQNHKNSMPFAGNINLDKHISVKKPDYIQKVQENYHLERQLFL